MARMVSAAVLATLMLILGGCAGYNDDKGASICRPPPVEGLEWGMSPEEAMAALSLSEDEAAKEPDDAESGDAKADGEASGEGYASSTVRLIIRPQLEVFGVPGTVELFFSRTDYGVDGLAGVSAVFEPESLERLKENINAVWDDAEVDEITAEYMRTTWKDIRNGEMPQALQEAVRTLYDGVAPGYFAASSPGGIAGPGEVWSELPLSTCSLYEYENPATGPKLVINGRHAMIALCALRLSAN